MSGNRTAMNQAVAPEKNAIQAQGDATRRQQANLGTARGGGTSSTNQQQQTNQMAQIDNALLQARPEAAKQTAAIGKDVAQVGQSQMAEALQALGIGAESAKALGDVSNQSSKNNQEAFNGFLKAIV